MREQRDDTISREIQVPDSGIMRSLLGDQDANLRLMERRTDTRIFVRGSKITIKGEKESVALAENLILQVSGLVKKGYPVYSSDMDYACRILQENRSASLEKIFLDAVYISSTKKMITPKSVAQKHYVDAIRHHDIVFAIGPAGTGKTYLAMAAAVASLMEKKVNRIILTRPAVEAGEKLGFLPGDLAEKVNPYLRPVYDALYDMIPFERASSFLTKGIIEVAPLAFMRGRTLNDAFVILDEAQNTTSEQMKMFLTRLGFGSKAVITGDVTQTDLPPDKISGLVEAETILSKTPGIEFVYFTEIDVVRHPLVQEIIRAYNHLDRKKKENR
ncbi:MAG TPA: PhoH family protein [Syntrophales bacterium]|nr:PhoH family protein [Syntrophales bacterium]HPX11470.1 PhoH family protein [Syntrophales bacterium]HQB29358.1 PhoH family protein [Syntrophales bacterium]HQN78691.1 PhoH family protein [Syntrophales bacterium]HQQ26797.1 PhoH family protein [Syntrophales bacterium]